RPAGRPPTENHRRTSRLTAMTGLHRLFPRRARALLLSLITVFSCVALVLVARAPFQAANVPGPTTKLEIKSGDHISLIGNTLAHRMQHDGWLETVLQSRFPKNQLTIRNLGFSGDELTLRLRSASFGSPDHWLGFTKADIVFAFFGYNESFAGAEGAERF